MNANDRFIVWLKQVSTNVEQVNTKLETWLTPVKRSRTFTILSVMTDIAWIMLYFALISNLPQPLGSYSLIINLIWIIFTLVCLRIAHNIYFVRKSWLIEKEKEKTDANV